MHDPLYNGQASKHVSWQRDGELDQKLDLNTDNYSSVQKHILLTD